MNGIELLMDEHQYILMYTDVVKSLCARILEGQEPDIAAFRECVEFARNYADKHHHGKEEKILFRLMLESSDPVAEKLVRNGMLVEHDLGRYHIGELVSALERYENSPTTQEKLAIITNASAQADLLRRHIEKEDGVVFTYAARTLKEEIISQVDEESVVFEEEARELGTQKKYTDWVTALTKNKI